MAFEVFRDSLQGATFTIIVCAVPICTLATYLRFVGTRRAGRRISLEDWLALAALVSFWVHATLSLWTIIMLNGKSRFMDGQITPSGFVEISKVGYVMQLNFPFNPTFAKLSLLALYYRIFYVSPTFVRWMWFLAILQICWFLAIFLCRLMFCIPISALWTPETPGRCINPSLLLAAGESVNAAIAFAMIALAMSMVRTLAMSDSTKWKLRFLFFLGGLTGAIDIISICEAYGTITLNLTYLCLVTIQMMTNTICCCAPVYRTILPRIPILSKLKERVKTKLSQHYGSNSNANQDDSPLATLVTVGGTVIKRGGRDQDWIRLGRPETRESSKVDVEVDTGFRQPPASRTPGLARGVV